MINKYKINWKNNTYGIWNTCPVPDCRVHGKTRKPIDPSALRYPSPDIQPTWSRQKKIFPMIRRKTFNNKNLYFTFVFKILHIFITQRVIRKSYSNLMYAIKHGATYRITIRLMQYFDQSCTNIMQVSMANQSNKSNCHYSKWSAFIENWLYQIVRVCRGAEFIAGTSEC